MAEVSRRLDPTFVRAQIELLRIKHPEIWEDDDALLSDMLEAETSLHEILTAAIDGICEAEVFAEGIANWIGVLGDRKRRYTMRAEAMRALAFKLMTVADVRKVELPEATLSIRAGQPRVIVTDEAALPPDCTRTRIEPDRVAIKDRLARGETVPGAELSNSEPSLTVRVK